MTNLIPDSWELPSYLAGDLIPMDRFRDRERATVPDDSWEPGQDADVVMHPKWKVRRGPSTTELHPKDRTPGWEDLTRPSTSPTYSTPPIYGPGLDWSNPTEETWAEAARRLNEVEPYDPEKHGPYEPAEMYSQDSLDALERAGFEPHEPGVWHRPVTTDEGEHLGASHILVYDPGHRRPTDNSRAPWHLMTDPESVGVAFSTLRGHRGALAAADEDRAQIRKIPKQARRYLAMVRLAAAQTPGRANADDWLARNPEESFEHDPREEARRWMEDHAHEYDEWHPDPSDYTYGDFGDMAGQTFHGDEAQSHVLPGSAYQFGESGRPGMSDEDWNRFHEVREQRARPQLDDDDDSGDLPQHEQDLADLGFNWEHRGDPDTTPAAIHQEGVYVKHQHDPEGRHLATHMIYRDPATNSWHVDSTDPSESNFSYESSTHQFPSDAISRYHDNAERAFLPTRGYEPHRGRSWAITHWTRTDTDPNSGQQYEHEISNQPSEGERVGTGWLGHTVSEGMIAPSHGTGPLRRQDLADVVREQDRTGRGLHPGGSQDYRITRNELLGDPSVSRLGTPNWVSDDGKVNSALWKLPHPNPPSQTVFDPTAPNYAREVPSENPWINAEARYNWDKGGYDFGYTHNGENIHPTSEHFPAGAPVHVPGRQTRLPLEGTS